MPKLKTRKSASKRFKVTPTGKILRMKGGRNHMRRRKASRVLQQYKQKMDVSRADVPRVKRALAGVK